MLLDNIRLCPFPSSNSIHPKRACNANQLIHLFSDYSPEFGIYYEAQTPKMDEPQNAPVAPIRSLNCNVNTFVAFISRTHRKVDVFWIDYDGKRVKYATLKEYGDTFTIYTFVTHPWTFKDAESGDQLVHSDNQEVYFPEPPNPNGIGMVLIGIPSKFSYPLKRLGVLVCTAIQNNIDF